MYKYRQVQCPKCGCKMVVIVDELKAFDINDETIKKVDNMRGV